MIIVDNALKAREAEGRPIRVALIGAGFMSRGLGNHIVNTMTGMRMVAVYNRDGAESIRFMRVLRRERRDRAQAPERS